MLKRRKRKLVFCLFVPLISWWFNGLNDKYIYIYIYIYTSSGKGYLLAFQKVLNDSCEPECWYIQRRRDEENTIYLVLRVSCYQPSAK